MCVFGICTGVRFCRSVRSIPIVVATACVLVLRPILRMAGLEDTLVAPGYEPYISLLYDLHSRDRELTGLCRHNSGVIARDG